MTSVLPLRPSISWKKATTSLHFAHVPAPPVCDTFRHVLRVNRNLDVGRFVDTTEDLNGSPKLGSWHSLSAWHLASKKSMRCSSTWQQTAGKQGGRILSCV